MAKTNPIGVRFDVDILQVFKEDDIATSPQKALNFLTKFYLDSLATRNQIGVLVSNSKLFLKKEVVPDNSIKSDSASEVLSQVAVYDSDFMLTDNSDDHSQYSVPSPEVLKITKLIAEVESQKIPKERDTPLGRKIWLSEQNKKINDLKQQVK